MEKDLKFITISLINNKKLRVRQTACHFTTLVSHSTVLISQICWIDKRIHNGVVPVIGSPTSKHHVTCDSSELTYKIPLYITFIPSLEV